MNVKGGLKGNWKFFESQWINDAIATGLDKIQDANRIATFLTVISNDCYMYLIYVNLNLTEEEMGDIAAVIAAHLITNTKIFMLKIITVKLGFSEGLRTNGFTSLYPLICYSRISNS